MYEMFLLEQNEDETGPDENNMVTERATASGPTTV